MTSRESSRLARTRPDKVDTSGARRAPWLDAGTQAGFARTDDVNGYRQAGFAVLKLMGDANWWLPEWANRRLPVIHLDD